MRAIFKFEDLLVAFEKGMLALLVLVMVALSAAQLVMRLFFSSGILWADPLLRHFVLWAGFFGAALAARHNRHFALDVAHKLLPEKHRRALERVAGAFAAAVCVALLAAAVKFLRQETAAGVTLFSIGNKEIPALWLEGMIPAGFALVLFHTVTGLFDRP